MIWAHGSDTVNTALGAGPFRDLRTNPVRRIAIVAPSLEILGGQGIQARSLAQALSEDGFEVLFIPVNPRFPPGLRWLRQVPVLRTLLNQLLYFVGLAQLRQADVVHVFSASYWSFLLAPVPAIVAARLFGKRVVLNYHSGEAEDHLTHWGRRVHPWLGLVDAIVVPSVYLQSVFARHGYSTRVVRNMIDTSAFHFRERLALRPRLMSNRNLEQHYRVDVTLKAFALLKKQRPDACLVVAGYGSEAARLKQWVASEGLADITFLGRVEPEDIPGLYDDADVFINASDVDNQPISILEAFASGLPVVSTPTGDIAHMVVNGQRGTLVPRDNPVALADAIAALLDAPDNAAAMARRARAEVENYTWAEISDDWIAVYCNEPGGDRTNNLQSPKDFSMKDSIEGGHGETATTG
jgi:glycosyltransferase involved in cell wall biosynthesis